MEQSNSQCINNTISFRPVQAPPLLFSWRRPTAKITQAPAVNYPDLLSAGIALIEGGVNVIPINDHKTPADPPLPFQKWKKYQTERVTKDLLRKWANTPGVCGWAMVGGKISGGLVIVDIDVAGFIEKFIEAVKLNPEVRELAYLLPIQQTGSGNHQIAFRCGLSLRNDKLAWVPADNTQGREAAIETRAEGGYAIVSPSHCPKAEKHGVKHKQAYKVIQGDFANIPTITDRQATILLELARSLDEMPLTVKEMKATKLPPNRNGGGVIGAFNRVYDIQAILERYKYVRQGNRYLAPDSTTGDPGVYIFPDTGRCYSHHRNDALNDGHAHNAFSAFCVLEHGNNVKAAVKAAATMLGPEAPPFKPNRKNGKRTRSAGSGEEGQSTGPGAEADDGDAKPDKDAPDECREALERLNQRHAVVMLGGKCVILNEVLNPTFNRPEITFSGVPDFKNCYSNERVFINKVFVPITKVWLASPDRRQYEGIVFAPGKDTPGFYNLFRGYVVKPAKGDWFLMQQHIFEVIANGNEAHFKYLMAWMARLLQDPGGERPGTAIVQRGKQGVGKGRFASGFGEIFGSHFLHITNPIQLVGKFNNHLKDCLLCFVDEGQWAGDRKAEGVLKAIITEDTIMCEPKGKDPFPIKNLVHLIIASNSQWVVPAGLEERRFLVLDVSDKHMQDHEYFAAISNQMNHGGREAMLFELLEMNLSGINLRKAPRTNALFDQVIDSMKTEEKFWYERLRAGTILNDCHCWVGFIPTERLYKDYVFFADELGARKKLIDSQFGKALRRLCPGMKRGKEVIKSQEIWGYCFPSLEDCRSKFEALVGRKLDWGTDDDD